MTILDAFTQDDLLPQQTEEPKPYQVTVVFNNGDTDTQRFSDTLSATNAFRMVTESQVTLFACLCEDTDNPALDAAIIATYTNPLLAKPIVQ